MPFEKLPSTVNNCCFCVTDLRAAVAIIAVLGIVTSPAVTWGIVRHSYVIRMSCLANTSATRPDVLDINFNNVMSFGFGANAGLNPSCLSPSNRHRSDAKAFSFRSQDDEKDKKHKKVKKDIVDERFSENSTLIKFVKGFGWAILIMDLVFLTCSIVLLIKLFRGTELPFMKAYMWSLVFSAIMSFIYGFTYVIICVIKGGSFPIFEFVFILFDLSLWIYFLIVVNSYRIIHREELRSSSTA